MEWELTEAQIQTLYGWDFWHRIYTEGIDIALKAQAKKLVEKIEEKNKYHRFGFEDGTLLIYKEDWQELRRQVGLK